MSTSGEWQARLAQVVETMREMSRQTDPQEMNRAYRARMRHLLPLDGVVSLSRRGLTAPRFRVTRSSRWKEEINPWKEQHRLPLLEGGLLAELIYADEPRLIESVELSPGDPAREYLDDHCSLAAIPLYDQGTALNMVVLMRKQPAAFVPEQFPELVWLSNLYGRATTNLVLVDQLREAYEEIDFELKVIANIQHALLPARMPAIPTMGLAAHYQTARRAGGDYYDFFPLAGGQWGLLIADVSGHGPAAAVVMAITHALAHTYPGTQIRPGELLEHVNGHLHARYTTTGDTFVTAFYGIYDPQTRRITYASAGHNPPRLKRCSDGSLALLNAAGGLPLGLVPERRYEEAVYQLVPGDQLVLYTDGITEASGPDGTMFGLARLDKVLENCSVAASDLLRAVLEALAEFTAGRPPDDDRTLLVAKIS
jgi:sigma-B regulation protein RsbU (phosphoserine phosphatase)